MIITGKKSWTGSPAHIWESEFASVIAEGMRAIEEFAKRAAECGANGPELLAMRLGVHEAIVNAIRHGNQFDPKKRVRLLYQFVGAEARIEVEDEGSGFDLSDVPDPHQEDNLQRSTGRGLAMMQHFMTKVWFNRRGNQVVMTKHFNPTPARSAAE